MCIPIARQRLGKHIPTKRTRATERPLLGNGLINTHNIGCVFCVVRAEGL
jgi:hypothetical protein